jgi:hypothetical protein
LGNDIEGRGVSKWGKGSIYGCQESSEATVDQPFLIGRPRLNKQCNVSSAFESSSIAALKEVCEGVGETFAAIKKILIKELLAGYF